MGDPFNYDSSKRVLLLSMHRDYQVASRVRYRWALSVSSEWHRLRSRELSSFFSALSVTASSRVGRRMLEPDRGVTASLATYLTLVYSCRILPGHRALMLATKPFDGHTSHWAWPVG